MSKLIYDLGLHTGFDAEFYLRKGFEVIALEAVPSLAEAAAKRLSEYKDRVTIINKAFFERPGEKVTFYTVPGKDDWGSLFKGTAEKGVQTSVPIEVETIDLASLFEQYGVPYYIKCDMEGGDRLFLQQLLTDDRRPAFVSVEISDGTEAEMLERCGYDTALIVNQSLNRLKTAPNPPREGDYVEAKFSGETSGLFGREHDPNGWMPISDAKEVIRMWKHLQKRCADLVPGWADVHVCKSNALS